MNIDNALIVVGVDDTDASRAALDIALDEAVARHGTVEAVSAWAQAPETIGYDPELPEEARARVTATLDAVVRDRLAQRETRPIVSQTVVHGYAGPVLVDRSEGALMLVVGSDRKGGLARAFLGSVSEYCVRHATVPVLVVPNPARIRHDHAEAVPSRAAR